MHDHVALGFDLAFKYRNPAMILADGAIGQMMEKVVLAPSARARPTRRSPPSAASGLPAESRPTVPATW